MKTFTKIIFVFLILIFVIIIISYLLPKSYKVERVIYIKADKSVIFNLTSNFTKWHLWTPWTKAMDSTANFELVGIDGQVGTQWKWTGKVLGNGEMKITEILPNEVFAYDLSFDKGKYQSKGNFSLKLKATPTRFPG